MAKQVTILDKSDAEDLLKRLEKVNWKKLKRGAQGRAKPTLSENQAAIRVHDAIHDVLLDWLDEIGLIDHTDELARLRAEEYDRSMNPCNCG